MSHWLNCGISDSEVELSDCHLLRKDRSDGRIGGGIAFYIRKNRNFEYEKIYNETSFEFITLKLKFKNKKAFYVSSVYRPPDSSISANNWNELLDLLSCPAGSEHIILGDINVDLLKSDSKEWINSAKISGYNQLIDSPTRVTDSTTSLIDHIYVSSMDNISSFGNLDIPLSDHQLIFVLRKLNF
jgi:hypothetical protein